MRLHEITNAHLNQSFRKKLQETTNQFNYVTHVERKNNFVQIWAKDNTTDEWQGYISAYLIPHEQLDGSSRLVLNPSEPFVVPSMRRSR